MTFNPSTKVSAIVLPNQGEIDLDEFLVEAHKLGIELLKLPYHVNNP
jgi:hypothetical protein